MPGAPLPQANCQGHLAVGGISVDVAQVVDHEQGAGKQADPAGRGPQPPRHRAGLDVGGAHRGHQAEEDEDEDLPQAGVAVGVGASGVEPGGRDRRGPDGEQPPLAAEDHECQAQEGSDPEAAEGGELDGAGGDLPGGGQSRRPGAIVVGASHAVGVVIGQVAADLQRQGHARGQQAPQHRELPHRGGRPGAQDDGGDGGRQGAQSHHLPPAGGTGAAVLRVLAVLAAHGFLRSSRSPLG